MGETFTHESAIALMDALSQFCVFENHFLKGAKMRYEKTAESLLLRN
jgi:hypothetical protein